MTMPYPKPVPLPTPPPYVPSTAAATPKTTKKTKEVTKGTWEGATLPYVDWSKMTTAGAPAAEEEPQGNLQFDAWLEAYGLTNAWGTGGAAIQKDIWTAYQSYLTGAAPVEEGAAGAAAAPPLFSPEEERLMTDLDNAIKVGQIMPDDAWKIVENYWNKERETTYRAQEATTRGQELLSGAFPGTTLPMTGPGGMGESLQKQYGLPNLTPAVKGLPMEQAQGVFGQAQQQLGLPATLPSLQQPNIQLPNWGAFMQNMPTFGGGNKYIDELLKEGRSTAPTLG